MTTPPRMSDLQQLKCRHFTGIQHDTCKAGIAYASVRDESTRPFGFPCLGQYAGNATCPKLSRWTAEEAAEQEAAFEAAFTRTKSCLKAIRAKHGKARGLVDSMPCPNNCGGTLSYSIAGYNGHIHGKCSTEGCAAWLQ